MKRSMLLLAFAGPLLAQPAFEVATIKPNNLDSSRTEIGTNPGTVTIRNLSLRALVRWAWDVPQGQLTSPDWTADTRFDISARAATPAEEPELKLMMRDLLAHRLGVRVREEQRDLQVYFLVPAKGGPKFHESGPRDQTRFSATTEPGPGHFGRNKMMMTADRATMAELAEQLAEPLQRPVVDHTGLAGRYNLTLDPTAFMTESESPETPSRIDPMSMILTALPAQLGLKVESGRDTVKFWVVESANKTPSDN